MANCDERLRDENLPYEMKTAEIINQNNPNIKAVCHMVEDHKEDIRVYDRSTNELIGYVEVQSSDYFSKKEKYKKWNGYMYDCFQFFERRMKKSNLPTIFFLYDKKHGNYWWQSIEALKKTNPINTVTEARAINGIMEKKRYLPLESFHQNIYLEKIGEWFLRHRR